MTEAAPPPPPPVLPPQPPALARAIALDLVTRFHLRLVDPRDSRLGALGGRYELGAAGWTGTTATFVGFYTPSADPRVAGPDIAARCAAAAQWGEERLRLQGAERADILLVALAPIPGSITPPTLNPAVNVGAVAIDPFSGDVTVILPIPRPLPQAGDIRARAQVLSRGADAPTLAAVDLAERQAVAGGYAAPARQQLVTTPYMTYSLIAAFVLVFVIETILGGTSGDPGLTVYRMGLLYFPGSEWWRFVASAFLHEPIGAGGGFGGLPAHVLFNSLAMFFVGRLVEQLYGRLVLVATFLVTAAGAGMLWYVSQAVTGKCGTSTLGASAGITGLLGLLVMLGRLQGRGVPAGIAHAMHNYAITYGASIVFFGFVIPNVNNIAHVCGFVVGLGVGALVPPLHRVGGRDLRSWERGAAWAAIGASAVAILFAAVNLASGTIAFPTLGC